MASVDSSAPQAALTQPLSGPNTWKGFDLADLRKFHVQRTSNGIEVPYFTRAGQHWRSKVFLEDGRSWWLGESKAQIPYGLETLTLGSKAVILTEGESDALALRLAFPTLAVLGIPGASSWRNQWTRCLEGFDAVYLSFDADRAGEKLTASVLESVPGACPIHLPAGADTRDVLQRLGRAAYAALARHARVAREFNETHRAAWAVRDAWKAVTAA